MKYYSENLKKVFDTEADCVKAEREYQEKVEKEKAEEEALASARKERAKEVEKAYSDMIAAQKHYTKLLNQFVKDYNSWHMTISTKYDDNLADLFWKLF